MAASGWPWNAQKVNVSPVKLVTDSEGKTFLQPQWDAPPITVNPWLVPSMAGEIRLQKPPLPYWCAAILYRVAGVEWNEKLSRLTPALLGFLATFFMAGVARRTLGRRAAWIAGLVWVSSYFVCEQYRLAMADPYLAFFALLAIWAWIADRTILFYVAIAFGILAKGPLIFVAPGIGLPLYHIFYRRRVPGPWWKHFAGIALLILIALPWWLYVYRHVENVWAMWKYESIGELPGAGNEEKRRPFWFYVPALFEITLPWTPLWIAGVVLAFLRKGRRWFAVAWYFVTVLAFSISPVKKNTYLLPVMPAQVLIVTDALLFSLATVRRFSKLNLLAWVQTAIAIAGGIAVAILSIMHLTGGAKFSGLLLGAAALIFGIESTFLIVRRHPRSWLWFTSAAYAMTIAVIFGMLLPKKDNQRSAKGMCDELLSLMSETHETLAPGKRPEEASLYLPLNLPVDLQAQTMLTIVDSPPSRQQTPSPTSARFADRVPWRKITAVQRVEMKTAPGEARWKIYRLTLE